MAAKFLNGVDLVSQKIVNLASPSAATDGVNKSYVDNLVAGLQWKSAVRAATTASGTLSTAYANGQTVDGVTLVTGDRILIKDQATGAENGIYVVQASGAPVRSTDADGVGELVPNATVYVSEGTTNADKGFTLTTNGTITVGTTPTAWAQVGGGGTTYSAGSGLNLASTTFSVVAGTGITVGANVAIDTSIVARKYAANIGDGTSTSITVTHNLNTRDVHVVLYNSSTFEQVQTDIVNTTVNTVTLTFATAPAAAAYRAVVIG